MQQLRHALVVRKLQLYDHNDDNELDVQSHAVMDSGDDIDKEDIEKLRIRAKQLQSDVRKSDNGEDDYDNEHYDDCDDSELYCQP